MPVFSIILPCYNAQDTIIETLKSLSAQTFQNWEAICIDDGSTDATVDLVLRAALCDPRIRFRPNSGIGPSQARNLGAVIAMGEILAFCDADDLWHPGKLAELAEIFTDPEVDGAYGRTGFFQIEPTDAQVFSTVPEGDLSIERLLWENPVCTVSNAALRADVFERTGGFDGTMAYNEGLEWLIRLVGEGARIVGLPSVHTFYRMSSGGLSSDLDAMCEGRARAIATAARYGVRPDAQAQAIYHRYLARRALRLSQSRTLALRHALMGLRYSPIGFFKPFRPGALTFAAACAALVLPRATRQSLFSRSSSTTP